MKSTGDLITRILATVCRFCPLCAGTRRWPTGRLAKLKRLKGPCPACRAYARLKAGT